MRKQGRGMVLFTVLVVACLLAMMSLTVAMHSIHSLRQDRQIQGRLQAEFAARAGLEWALNQLRWATPPGSIGLTAMPGCASSYKVSVLSNASGASPLAAPDSTLVPPGAVYLLSTGQAADGHQQRFSALALRPGTAGGDAMAVDATILMRDNTLMDAWDSTLGAYSAATLRNFTLQSNTVANNGVRIRDTATVKADVKIGVGGSLATTLDLRPSATLTGTASVATASVAIPSHIAPTPGSTDLALAGSTTQMLTPGSYRNLSLSGSSQLTLAAGTYSFRQINMVNSAQIRILGPVTVYLERSATLDDDCTINSAGSGADFKLYSTATSSSDLRLNGRSKVWMTAEGQHLSLAPYDDAEFFGAFMGAGIDAWDRGKIHYDKVLRASGVSTASSTAPWELRAVRLQ